MATETASGCDWCAHAGAANANQCRGRSLTWPSDCRGSWRFTCFRPVHVVERISQAMAVGIFKPMVLLPASWISELPSDVLEAVIAHELAHLRRWDLPINFMQRLLETLLFFHPAVWWVA